MNEYLENIILVRRLWNVEKDVQPGELLNPDRKSLLFFCFEKGHYCRVMFFYLLNTSANGFCRYCPRREGLRRWSSVEEHLPSFLTAAHHHIVQERTAKRRCHVW